MNRQAHTAIASALASIFLIGAVQADSTSFPDARREASPLPAASDPAARSDARPASAEQPKSAGSQLSLFIRGPGGDDVRLDYVPGNGWRSTDGLNAGAGAHEVVAETVAFTGDYVASASSSSGAHPLSVVVDGPTGFVYVWTQESEAWKFVGRLSDRRP